MNRKVLYDLEKNNCYNSTSNKIVKLSFTSYRMSSDFD